MFFGTFSPKLDDKGRLTLPAKFREEFAGGLMITKGQDHSLAIYPRQAFIELARKASQASRTDPEARAFVRALAAGADEQNVDGQGRIAISLDHRRYAELTKDCIVIGAVDYVEIWDAQAWDRYNREHEEAYSSATDESLRSIL